MTAKTTSIYAATVAALMLSTVAAQADVCANLPGMRLTAKENHLSLNDNMPVCVTREENGTIDFTFRITIANPVEVGAGDVRVVQKDDDPQPQVIIQGDNSSPSNKVTVHVQGEASLGDQFDFFIEVDGIGTLDPRVRVVDSNVQLMLQVQGLQDFAETYDLLPEELVYLAQTIRTE